MATILAPCRGASSTLTRTSVADRLGRTHRHYSAVVHLDDETAAPTENPADERTAALDDDRVRVLVDLEAEPLGHPRLEELVEGAPPAAAGIGLTSHHTTVSRSRTYDGLDVASRSSIRIVFSWWQCSGRSFAARAQAMRVASLRPA